MQKLQEHDVTFSIKVEQDDIPVRGNAIASGDDEEDTKCEDEILERLDDGDVWAWAYVVVTATCTFFSGNVYTGIAPLGACTYKNEEDFKEQNWEAMKKMALEDLNTNLRRLVYDVATLIEEGELFLYK